MNKPFDPEAVIRAFLINGAFVETRPHGNGHINDSYCVSFAENGAPRRYLLQRLNTEIFKRPELLMENVQRVTSHLAAKLAGQQDAERRVLSLVAARDGKTWHREGDGSFWRVFQFIENARAYESIETPAQAFETARAFGNFQRLLADLPAPRLHETIPAFHDTPKRFTDFEAAVLEDARGRVARVAPEIEFAMARKKICSTLLDASLPERVTHNDTKLNNVMFDASIDEALCVVDLDTVMPGLALYDFGDMVRTATSPTQEDERNLDRVTMRFEMFEALVRGYLSSAGDFLTSAEKKLLPVAGRVIAFEQGIRFLGDYLAGDLYYKVSYEGQNLDRCRTQFRLVESMEKQSEAMQRLVDGM